MSVFTFLLYAVIGVVVGVTLDETAGGLVGFVLGILIYKLASSFMTDDEREELF